MGGGWESYHCVRCPLTLVLGGSTGWDEAWLVSTQTVQVACVACGTLHRVTEERGRCQVTALDCPVRVARTETRCDVRGEERQSEFWVTEADWQPAGLFDGGIAAVAELPCRSCGQAAGMVTLEDLKLPFHVAIAGVKEQCPVCRGPMECFQVIDAI